MPVFETPQPITAQLELGVGHVRISAEDRTDTHVEIAPSDPGNEADLRACEQTTVRFVDGDLLVKAPRQRGLFGRSGSVDVDLALPLDSQVRATAREAAFYADGRLSLCRIRTSTGGIQIEEAGRLVLTTSVGDITVDRADGRLEATTGSGALRIGELGGPALLKSSNGSIVVDRSEEDLEAKAANGDIRIGEVTRGSVALSTSIGQIDIGIAPDTAALLDVRSVSGHVHNFMRPVEGPEPHDRRVEVLAHTTMGDVTVRHS